MFLILTSFLGIFQSQILILRRLSLNNFPAHFAMQGDSSEKYLKRF